MSHNPQLRSWVASAHNHASFPIQNLPMGVFDAGAGPRVGMAIGDEILDLRAAQEQGLLGKLDPAVLAAVHSHSLNAWMGLPAAQRTALRLAASQLLSDSGQGDHPQAAAIVVAQSQVKMLLPAQVGDYSDFYAGIHHAMNCGLIFRPEQPLQPNYKHLPVAYHGRASSLRPSGTPVQRPSSQILRDGQPVMAPTEKMDYEMELAIWVGPGNALGQPIDMASAPEHVAGFGLLNDWSARDIQQWESLPLGPFQSKNFMSSLSAWVVTSDAMAPFRAPRMAREPGDPSPLPYLDEPQDRLAGGLDVDVKVFLRTAKMREQGLAAHQLSHGKTTALYWTPAQMIAHQTVGGCDLRPGDLLGSGTISMEHHQNCGCLLEMTHGGKQPITLPNGEVRAFLHDGDEVIMRGSCVREGFVSIGFGDCSGMVLG